MSASCFFLLSWVVDIVALCSHLSVLSCCCVSLRCSRDNFIAKPCAFLRTVKCILWFACAKNKSSQIYCFCCSRSLEVTDSHLTFVNPKENFVILAYNMGKCRCITSTSDSDSDTMDAPRADLAIPSTSSSLPESDSNLSISKLMGTIDTLVSKLDQNASASDSRRDLIPTCDSESCDYTTSQLVEKVDQLQQIYNWSDELTTFNASRKQVGLAEKWDTIKGKLLQTFPTKQNYCQLLRNMLSKQQGDGESLMQYYFSKLSLLQRCGISEENAVSCLIDGLNDTFLKRTAEAASHKSPEALLAFLKICHERRSVYKRLKRGDSKKNSDFVIGSWCGA